jgi:hypothetical protein
VVCTSNDGGIPEADASDNQLHADCNPYCENSHHVSLQAAPGSAPPYADLHRCVRKPCCLIREIAFLILPPIAAQGAVLWERPEPIRTALMHRSGRPELLNTVEMATCSALTSLERFFVLTESIVEKM